MNAHYGVSVAEIAFLPIGYDASAWVYQVAAADGQRYFLKLRRGAIHTAPAAIARYLKAEGIKQIVAPLPMITGQLMASLEGYTLLLYPWIEGRSGMEAGLTDDQWIAYGALVRQIHTAQLPADLAAELPHEDFVLRHKWGMFVRQFSTSIQRRDYANPYERELSQFWMAYNGEIIRIVERAERLGSGLRQRPSDFVLCHADIHTANLIVAPDGHLRVVDWDQPIFAPKERDLMFVVGPDAAATREETLFFTGYGEAEIDALALAYYRYEWCVQEFVDFANRVFQLDDGGDETKADSVRGFEQLFASGDVVEVADKMARMAWQE
ncbi:MAG TPA: aminoglycoside phosphotransferase family protein [Ktedonobacterales bacterium]